MPKVHTRLSVSSGSGSPTREGASSPVSPYPAPPKSKKSEHEEDASVPKPEELLNFDCQGPAPDQTHYFLSVLSDKTVRLMSVPRMRMSEKWTRTGRMNPYTEIVTFDEFLHEISDYETVKDNDKHGFKMSNGEASKIVDKIEHLFDKSVVDSVVRMVEDKHTTTNVQSDRTDKAAQ